VPAPAVPATPNTESATKEVVSELVGYFRPVAEPGARVEQGGVIGVIESLGLPNEVLSPGAGTLSDYTVADGDPVEYGTVLARIKQ
jgi:biotin carboxyl carrier protein